MVAVTKQRADPLPALFVLLNVGLSRAQALERLWSSRRLGQRPVDRQALLPGRHPHGVALLHAPLQDQPGERVLQRPLDHPLQRPRAIGAVVALGSQPLLAALRSSSRPIFRSASSCFQVLQLDPALIFAMSARCERRNRDDFVNRFRNSGRKWATDILHH